MWSSSGLCMSFGMQLWPIKLKLYSWQRQLRDLHSQFDMLTHQASDVLVSQCCFHLADLKKSHHQRVSEFHRIRSIFGTNERQWVEAQVENAKQQAILMAPKSQVSSDEEHIHLDLHSLRRKHAELVGESNSYHKEGKILSEPSSHQLMKELDEVEKINAKLSTAVEEVTLEHR